MKQRLWFIAALIATIFSIRTAITHGQTGGVLHPYIYGSEVASGDLTLDSTINATKGDVLINPSDGNVGIGLTNPSSLFHVKDTDSWADFKLECTDTDCQADFILKNDAQQWDIRLTNGDYLTIIDVTDSSAVALRIETGTQQMLIAGGDSSFPGIASINDQNTGIYWPGGDVLDFATGGVQRCVLGTTAFNCVQMEIGVHDGAFRLAEDASSPLTSGLANQAVIFARDNGSGKTQVCAAFFSGDVQCFATQL